MTEARIAEYNEKFASLAQGPITPIVLEVDEHDCMRIRVEDEWQATLTPDEFTAWPEDGVGTIVITTNELELIHQLSRGGNSLT